MTAFYLDTSALVKRYRKEHGTDIVDELWDKREPEDRLYGSSLCALEFTSTILRRAKGSTLEERVAHEILSRFRREAHGAFDFLPIDSEIVERALAVVETHRLRSADAIHMATVLIILDATRNEQLVLFTSDREMLGAAETSGVMAVDPTHADALERLRRLRRYQP